MIRGMNTFLLMLIGVPSRLIVRETNFQLAAAARKLGQKSWGLG